MIQFEKMHGLGNDFAVVCSTKLPSTETITRLSNRRTGIGFDQWLHITHIDEREVHVCIFNADGSIAMLCGNGLRCIGRYLDDRNLFSTGMRIILGDCNYQLARDRTEIAVDLRKPQSIQQTEDDVYAVEMSNPHVVYLHDVSWQQMKQASEKYDANVHALTIRDSVLDVLHYERGAGRTAACGSGAMACFAVARLRNPHLKSAQVFVPGGVLRVWVDGDAWWQSGPAVSVYRGTLVHDVAVGLDAAC